MTVEGLDERILPGRAGFDVAGLRVVEATPVAQCLADEFGTVVAADQCWSSSSTLDDLLERVDGLVGAHPARRWGG